MFGEFDPVLLARAQFAFTVSFHFIFPALSIGLASYLMVLEGLWLKTGKKVYLDLFHYWIKIFSVGFGMGVVSGIVMSYQFGTNWSEFSHKAGPIIGPLMGYEVLTAFFLEAGFLGVMLFGMNKVGKYLHFFATSMVAVGTLVSATWIISVNSWMQTPVGYEINDIGQFVPAGSWATIIFNPSFSYRLAHTVLGAFLTTSMLVGAVGAWHLLKDRSNPGARKMFSMAMWMAALAAPTQMLVGDMHGLNALEHQPVKVLAIEGHFESSPNGASFILAGLPSNEEEQVNYKLAIPYLGSLILKHDPFAPLPGLKDYPKEDWPPVAIVFWSFRIMVAIGLAMFALGILSLIARKRKNLYEWTLLHRFAVIMGPSGFVAVIAGWVTTEVGRQPFTIYGLMRTAESHSPIDASAIAASLIGFIVIYFAVFGAGIYYMLKMMAKAPTSDGSDEHSADTCSTVTTSGRIGVSTNPQSGA